MKVDDVPTLERSYDQYLEFVETTKAVDGFKRRGKRLPPGLREIKPSTLAEGPGCAHQFGTLFGSDDHTTPTSDGPVVFSLCRTPKPGAEVDFVTPSLVKAVTLDIARSTFDTLWWASVEQEVDDIIIDVHRTLDKREPLTELQPCKANVMQFRSLTTRSIDNPQPATVSATDVVLDERKAAEHGYFISRKMFRPEVGNSKSERLKNAPLYSHISLAAYCGKDGRPTLPRDIEIRLPEVLSPPIQISGERISQNYKLLTRSEPEYGIDNGYIDKIDFTNQYYFWLQVLEDEISTHRAIIERRLGKDAAIVTSHFAHLLLASFFVSDAKLAIQ